jgi:hypothetical protein
VNAVVGARESVVPRGYQLTGKVLAGTTETTIEQVVTAIDSSRTDIQNYITEYTTYFEKRESSSAAIPALKATIAKKEEEIR